MQEMGETREPMARDCWADAHRLANNYAKVLNRDFWICFAAKQHVKQKNAIVCGWEVIVTKPKAGMVGVMVFKWSHKDQRLEVEPDLCLPYDVPISDAEMSTKSEDFIPTVSAAAKKSGSILLA